MTPVLAAEGGYQDFTLAGGEWFILIGSAVTALLALAVGDRSQKDFARARLYALSRDLGDQLGVRRWRPATPPRMVSLSPRPASLRPNGFAPMIGRWRTRLEPSIGCVHP